MSFRLTDEHRTIRQAVQEFGENEIEPDARITKIYEGTSEIQKNTGGDRLV